MITIEDEDKYRRCVQILDRATGHHTLALSRSDHAEVLEALRELYSHVPEDKSLSEEVTKLVEEVKK